MNPLFDYWEASVRYKILLDTDPGSALIQRLAPVAPAPGDARYGGPVEQRKAHIVATALYMPLGTQRNAYLTAAWDLAQACAGNRTLACSQVANALATI